MKRTMRYLILGLVILCMCPLTVLANGPVPAPEYWFTFSNLPEDTKYVDMLIELPEDDPCYVPLVADNLPGGFSEDAPIVTYCEDGYRSYTFHYADAVSIIEIDQDDSVYFFTDDLNRRGNRDQINDIYERGSLRLALLDEYGNIQQVSRVFSLRPERIMEYQLNGFHYDAQEDRLDRDTAVSGLGVAIFFLTSVAGVVVTCFLEDLMALPFKLWKKYHIQILCTNICSQVLMRLLHTLLYGWVFNRYIWTVIVLEVLVYSGEFLLYKMTMKDVPTKRILLYTVSANTVSLVLSIFPMMIA